MRHSRSWALASTMLVLTGCPAPAVMTDAGPEPHDAAMLPIDTGHDAASIDAFVAADDAPDAGPLDAAVVPDAGPANPCEAAGFICVHLAPGVCGPPNMLDPMHSCSAAGDACCIPSAGHAVPCTSVGGTCAVHMPGVCLPPSRIGEPELYTCSTGLECCIPPRM